MIVKAVRCYECKSVIFSRCKLDVRACDCFDLNKNKRTKWIAIKGGTEDPRVTAQDKSCFEIVEVDVGDLTHSELHRDWNLDINNYGVIYREVKDE